jgi:hypothetical protein
MVLVAATVTNRRDCPGPTGCWWERYWLHQQHGELPVLQQLHAEDRSRWFSMLEAAWGDVLAVLTVGLLLSMRSQGGEVAQGLVHGLWNQVGIALLFAIPGGVLWSRLLHVLSEQRFWQVLTVLYCSCPVCGDGSARRQRVDRGAGLWLTLQLSRR